MPTYVLRNKDTEEIFEKKMTIVEFEVFLQENPNTERYHSIENFPGFGDAIRMSVPRTTKSDSSFEKYVIQPMMEKVHRNTIKGGHKHKTPREW